MSATDDQPHPRCDNKKRQRRLRILLGVTGSVAAVKCPELALKLVQDYDMDVKILLTRGGSNFWTKASDYDKQSWTEIQHRLSSSSTSRKKQKIDIRNRKEDEKQKDCHEGSIEIHGEYVCKVFLASTTLLGQISHIFCYP